ncbi:MAG: hypothetical protein ACK5MH_05390 [Bacteroidales bacterium]
MKKLITIILLVVTSLFMFSCGEEETNDLSNKNTNNKKVVIDEINYLKIGELNSEGQILYYFTLDELKAQFMEINPGNSLEYIDLVKNINFNDQYNIICLVFEEESNESIGIAYESPVKLIRIDGIDVFCIADPKPSSARYNCKQVEGCNYKGCEPYFAAGNNIKCRCVETILSGKCELRDKGKPKIIDFSLLEGVVNMNSDFEF